MPLFLSKFFQIVVFPSTPLEEFMDRVVFQGIKILDLEIVSSKSIHYLNRTDFALIDKPVNSTYPKVVQCDWHFMLCL